LKFHIAIRFGGAVEPEQPFIVFPAIDLRGGEVVRLKEGDPNRQTNYSTDPAGTAQRWITAGASWLHVVNLDGAFGESASANLAALRSILAEAGRAGIPVQFGGGMRGLDSIGAALDAGVSRAILGTVAVEQPRVLEQALTRWGAEMIGVSLDARDGRVQVRGWQSDTPLQASDAARDFQQKGLRWLVFTDIARDGLQTGLNLPATVALAQTSGLRVIASGGVSRLEDVRGAQQAGLAGAIVGRALYEGAINPVDLFR
jgi:phosphoribosylformimino-5-aminoimidazole carboxamide ribotide isomerase